MAALRVKTARKRRRRPVFACSRIEMKIGRYQSNQWVVWVRETGLGPGSRRAQAGEGVHASPVHILVMHMTHWGIPDRHAALAIDLLYSAMKATEK